MSEDDDPWRLYVKNVKRYHPVKAPRQARTVKNTERTVLVEETLPPVTRPPNPAPVTFPKRAERRLRQGEVVLEAQLDLHGLTQEKAYTSLQSFIPAQARQGRRVLLVITGKGREGVSVLRANFPRWCAEPALAAFITTLRPAAPRHGGNGAWYVILKRS